jgi:hypothetical protein
MASSTITFQNPNTGAIKEAPVGFSWTTLFFAGIPALIRGHIGIGVVIIIIGLFTLFWSDIIFAFIYNKMYVKNLIGEGFKVSSTSIPEEQIASKLGMMLPKL